MLRALICAEWNVTVRAEELGVGNQLKECLSVQV